MATLVTIADLADPRIAAYRNLKDRELAREGGRFIAEGEVLVRRLLESDFPVESVLSAAEKAADLAPLVPADIPLYVTDHSVVNGIIGFKFHSGVMAIARRKPPLPLELAARTWADPVTLVICPEIANTDNLGSIIRVSAAFGVTALLLGERCCDPFYRQSVRVSMGTIFRLPVIQSRNLLADLTDLRRRWGVELAGTVLADDAEPLASAGRGQRLGLLFGNEAQGLRPEHIAACDRRITIPMSLGTDSLNVGLSAAVFLYHFTHVVTA